MNLHNKLLKEYELVKNKLYEYEDKCIEINLTLNPKQVDISEILTLHSEILNFSPELVSSYCSSDGGVSTLRLYAIKEDIIALLEIVVELESLKRTVCASYVKELLRFIDEDPFRIYFNFSIIVSNFNTSKN